MKKVYITCLHLQHGGIEMVITNLANALVKREYSVEILCSYDLGKPVYTLDSSVKVKYLTDVKPNRNEFRLALKRKNIFGILKEGFKACKVLYLKKSTMKRAIKDITEGTIISTRNEHSVILSKYGKVGVKKIAQLHHDHNFQKKLMKDFREHYKNIDVFVLLTEGIKEEIQNVMKQNQHTKLMVIPNFLPQQKDVEVTEKKNQVVSVGRLHEVKGFLRLLEIWKKVSEDKSVVLKLIGEGDERVCLEQKIEELGIQDTVILTGALEHEKVLEEMESSLLYVMTSKSEAFPLVLVEAMSVGLPLIAFDVRVGPRAIIQEGVNGYLIQDGDEEAFACKIIELLKDSDKIKTMSKKSKELSAKFSEDNVMKMWMEII